MQSISGLRFDGEKWTLPKTGEIAKSVFLTPQHIDQIVQLNTEVYRGLGAEERGRLLVDRSGEDFRHHMDGGNPIIGIMVGDRLVGQSLMTYPSSADAAPPAGVLSGKPLDNISLLKAMIVEDAYRGNNLQFVMTDILLRKSQDDGRPDAYSIASVNNQHSYINLLRRGLDIELIGKGDGPLGPSTDVYLLHGRASRVLQYSVRPAFSKASAVMVSPTDICRQQELLASGYHGVAYDKSTDKVAYTPTLRVAT